MPRTFAGYGRVDMPASQPLPSLGDYLNLAAGVRQFEQQDKDAASNKAVEDAFNASKGDVSKTITALESQGRWKEASTLKTKQADIQTAQLDQVHQRINEGKTLFSQGAQFLTEIQKQPDLYTQLRPKLLEMASSVDPRLVDEIPEQYDPARVKGMLNFVTGAATEAEARSRALDTAKEKLALKGDAAKALELDHKIASEWFSVSPNQQDWESSLEHARAIGVSDDVLNKLGPTWSPEAVEQARRLGLTPEQRGPKTGTPTDWDDYLATYARDVAHKPVSALTTADKDAARQRFATSGRAPDTGPSTEATLAQKATAERWKADELAKLEERYRASIAPYRTAKGVEVPTDGKGQPAYFFDKANSPIIPMTLEDLDKAKKQVQTSYLAQINAAPGGPVATGVPAAVAATLKGQKAGNYTLTDGSKWTLDKHGVITATK